MKKIILTFLFMISTVLTLSVEAKTLDTAFKPSSSEAAGKILLNMLQNFTHIKSSSPNVTNDLALMAIRTSLMLAPIVIPACIDATKEIYKRVGHGFSDIILECHPSEIPKSILGIFKMKVEDKSIKNYLAELKKLLHEQKVCKSKKTDQKREEA